MEKGPKTNEKRKKKKSSSKESADKATDSDPADGASPTMDGLDDFPGFGAAPPNFNFGLREAIGNAIGRGIERVGNKVKEVITERFTVPSLAWKEGFALKKVQAVEGNIAQVQSEITSIQKLMRDRETGFSKLREQYADYGVPPGQTPEEIHAQAKDQTRIEALNARLETLHAKRAAAEQERLIYTEQKQEHARTLLHSCEDRLRPYDEKIQNHRAMIEQLDVPIQKTQEEIAALRTRVEEIQELMRTNASPEVRKQAQKVSQEIQSEIKAKRKAIKGRLKAKQKHLSRIEKIMEKSSKLRTKTHRWRAMEQDAGSTYNSTSQSPNAPRENQENASSSNAESGLWGRLFNIVEGMDNRKMTVANYVTKWNAVERDVLPPELEIQPLKRIVRDSLGGNPNRKLTLKEIEGAIATYFENTGIDEGNINVYTKTMRVGLLF